MFLPDDFTTYTNNILGNTLYQHLLNALEQDAPVSIRLNPFKTKAKQIEVCNAEGNVPWCKDGFYLKHRPNFTFDPFLHAGMYYVQEAASMFVCEVVRQHISSSAVVLDLCAAPGGKSTALRSVLPADSVLFCNEPVGLRAQILSENMQKFGHPDVVVTNNLPADYKKSGLQFDVILSDVPCSGEGMFRKDKGAIDEWSRDNVEKCWRLQRQIVSEIWSCLRPGGILIYSTCTFNCLENEQNVEWIAKELGAELLPIYIEKVWNITPAIGCDIPAYRFIPGVSKGEGLFLAVLRKHGDAEQREQKTKKRRAQQTNRETLPEEWLQKDVPLTPRRRGDMLTAIPSRWAELYDAAAENLRVLHAGVTLGTRKGKDLIPHPSLALSTLLASKAFPTFELNHSQAIAFLRKEPVTLPADMPRGFVLLTFCGVPLGFEKNIGARANNLYPQEWRIKSTHIPEQNNIIKLK